MKHHLIKSLFLVASLLSLSPTEAAAQYPGWQHSGSMFILTTPEGANLPASAVVKDFPVLVRLNKDSFDFSKAKANGGGPSRLPSTPPAGRVAELGSLGHIRTPCAVLPSSSLRR